MEAAQVTIDAAREAQFPDRYSTAVGQLGSDNLDVRIGGIYALEGVAAEYPRHHLTVMELLAGFIREHSGEQWPARGSDDSALERTTRPDVQAALTAIGRRDVTHDRLPVDLKGAYLFRADLSRADLSRATLTGATLTGADLSGADLTSATLTDAILTDAKLRPARLTSAVLSGVDFSRATRIRQDRPANLTGADLTGADLTGADCTGADCTGAFLAGANLTRANLTGANLTRAHLLGANLTDSQFPAEAVVPRSWRRDPDSGRLKLADTNPGGATAD